MALLKFIAVSCIAICLLLLDGTNSRPEMISENLCEKELHRTCPCGPLENGKTANTTVQVCLRHDGIGCEPCYVIHDTEDPCDKFKNCETCSDALQECLSCPRGSEGNFCEIDLESRQTVHVFNEYGEPVHGLSRQEANSHRMMKRAESCAAQVHIQRGKLECTQTNESKSCQINCFWGHAFKNGRTTFQTKCYFKTDRWNPPLQGKCEPFVNCAIKLKKHEHPVLRDGNYSCQEFDPVKPISCAIWCPDRKKSNDTSPPLYRTYTCGIDSKWHPPLPYCVIPVPMDGEKSFLPSCARSKD